MIIKAVQIQNHMFVIGHRKVLCQIEITYLKQIMMQKVIIHQAITAQRDQILIRIIKMRHQTRY